MIEDRLEVLQQITYSHEAPCPERLKLLTRSSMVQIRKSFTGEIPTEKF